MLGDGCEPSLLGSRHSLECLESWTIGVSMCFGAPGSAGRSGGGGDHSGQALRAAVHTAKDAGGGPLLPSQARRVWKVKLRGGALVSVLVCNVTTLMLDPDQ